MEIFAATMYNNVAKIRLERNKFTMKKLLALFLACVTVCLSFAACGEKPVTEATTSADTVATTEVKDPNLPELPPLEEIGDISGDFNILVVGNYAWNDFNSDGEQGTAVDTAVYRRNMYLKEKYDINVINEEKCGFMIVNGGGEGYMRLSNDHMAGNYTYDAASIGTWDVATLAYSGVVHDLVDLEYLDLTKPYWDQKANEDLMINGKMYYTTGDIGVVDNIITNAVLFNKEMRKAYELENPYDLVKSGDWTMEKLAEMVRKVGEDANQDGIYDENDVYGLMTWNDATLAILAAAGEKICSITDNGEIELSLYNERVVNLFDAFSNMYFDYAHTYNYQYDTQAGASRPSSVWDTNRTKMFDSNQALFYFTTFATVPRHRDSETDFGILPYPKFEKEQENYGHVVSDFGCQFICVPKMSKDLRRTGIVLEELAYKGKELLTPAYYDQTLVGQYTRDEESAEMLDIIFSTRVYDVGMYYKIGNYRDALIALSRTRSSLSTIYDTSLNIAKGKIDAINGFFSTLTSDAPAES